MAMRRMHKPGAHHSHGKGRAGAAKKTSHGNGKKGKPALGKLPYDEREPNRKIRGAAKSPKDGGKRGKKLEGMSI